MLEITHPRIQCHITEHVGIYLITPLCETVLLNVNKVSQDHEHETPIRKSEIMRGTTG